MAQHGRSGHPQDDNGAETAAYIFNPMSYNYAQHHNYSAPTVLSQQDATSLNDFFDHPEVAYHAYNDSKGDIATGGLNNPAALTTNAHMSNDPSHATFRNHMPQQRFGTFDFTSYHNNPQSHQQQQSRQSQPQHQEQRLLKHDATGDAAAGASALLGLSASQEPNSLLSQTNYMTWGYVGAQIQAPVQILPPKANSTSQINQSMQAPPEQSEVSWADITSAAHNMQQQQQQQLRQSHEQQQPGQRTRHQSLQLDTSNHVPIHQNAWQNAPQSALPHTGPRRPPLVTYGSDNAFSPTGFTTGTGDEKQIAGKGAGDNASSTSLARNRQPPQLTRHQSMSAALPMAQSMHQSPVTMNAMSTPTHQTQAAFQSPLMSGNGTGRKRTFTQVDNMPMGNNLLQYPSPSMSLAPRNAADDVAASRSSGNLPPSSAAMAANSNGAANQASTARATNANTTASGATGQTRRRPVKEPKPARANLSDAQKRQNHILSEQKRRDTMKTNFDIIGKRVPAVRDGGTMSRSEILYHLANHLEALVVGNNVCTQLAGLTEAQLDAMDILDPEVEEAIDKLGMEAYTSMMSDAEDDGDAQEDNTAAPGTS